MTIFKIKVTKFETYYNNGSYEVAHTKEITTNRYTVESEYKNQVIYDYLKELKLLKHDISNYIFDNCNDSHVDIYDKNGKILYRYEVYENYGNNTKYELNAYFEFLVVEEITLNSLVECINYIKHNTKNNLNTNKYCIEIIDISTNEIVFIKEYNQILK